MDHDLHPTGHEAGAAIAILLPAAALLVCAGIYLHLARRLRGRDPVKGWNRWRTASFTGGLGLLAVALLPPIGMWAHADFRGHMVQHLLVGMYAPLALVFGAPVTLLLRVLPPARGRKLTAILHSAPATLLTHPATAWLLSTGSLALLYLGPLYDALSSQPAGHWLLNAHFPARRLPVRPRHRRTRPRSQPTGGTYPAGLPRRRGRDARHHFRS